MGEVFDKTLRALATASQMREVRQNLISSNVANAETPGFKAKKMDFEGALKSALAREGMQKAESQHADHFQVGPTGVSGLKPDIYDNPEIDVSNDGNTVDLEREMSSLVENSTMHRAAVQLINKKLAALKYAASDGGR